MTALFPDVVVIGGGPAGLGAGIGLSRSGARTILFEARPLPVEKPCGEGLLPLALGELARLGVSSRDLHCSGRAISGVRYFAPSGRSARFRFPDGGAAGIERSALSRLLLARARELAPLELRDGCRATASRDERGVKVLAAGRTLRPRLLVLADGLRTGTQEGVGVASDRRHPSRWGVRQHYRVAPWTDDVEVHFANGLEAYVTPVGADVVNVAVLFDRDARRRYALDAGRRSARGLIDGCIRCFPALAEALRGSSPRGDAAASGPFHVQASALAVDGAVLIGDSSGYLDPITGEGVGIALAQARLLGETVSPLLADRGRRISRADLLIYAASARATARRANRLTHLLLWARHHPGLMERAVAALDDHPTLLDPFLRRAISNGPVEPKRVRRTRPLAALR